MSDSEFQDTQGGSLTYPAQCGSLKKGDHIVINGCPCKIMELTTSKTGKHGHAKASITAVDIFTGKKLEESAPTSHKVDCPNIKRNECDLVSIDDSNFVTYIDENGDCCEDVNIDDNELANKLREAVNEGKSLLITIVEALNIKKVLSFRQNMN